MTSTTRPGAGRGNSRNGVTGKRLLTDVGGIELAVPRDRNGSFEPQIVRKGQTRLDGFNDRIIALYARGMTTRAGLTVKAELDRNAYPKGIKITDAELAAVGVTGHKFHGEWNYDIQPKQRVTSP
jgi:transposase-like protein